LTKANIIKNLKEFIRIIFRWLILKFKRLPRFSKLALILFIILVILLTQSIIRSNLKNRQEKELKNFDQIITEVIQKRDGALASLIYQDEKNARLLLIQAKEQLKALSKKYTDRPEVINLENEINEELNKLRHEVNISEPTLIANFKNLDSGLIPAPISLRIGNNLYTQNHNNQTIYNLNLNSRIITATQLPDINSGNFIIGTIFSNNELLLMNTEQVFFSFNPTNNQQESISIPLMPQAKIAGMAVFNNRLYLLDTANNQIARYRKTTQGFSQPSQWLDDNTVDLSNAVDLTIDGNIYVLKNNGEIIKLTKGGRVDFPLTVIDPPLQSPTKIKTQQDSNYLYILDPPTKRLIVITKDGQLINQYTSEVFDDLKDFVVLEKEAKIFILNGSSVYGIPAKHLE
jgi:hypothetical protein